MTEGDRQDERFRLEIQGALRNDDRRLGDVYRILEGNMDEPDFKGYRQRTELNDDRHSLCCCRVNQDTTRM